MKIMIIDDVMMNVLVLKHAVKAFGEVTGFQDVPRALGELRASHRKGTPYDLLFLDLLMPGLDGFEVLKEVQEMETGRDPADRTRVIVVTANGNRQSVRAAIQAGAAGYILKPIQPDRIQEEVRRLMEERGPREGSRPPGPEAPSDTDGANDEAGMPRAA